MKIDGGFYLQNADAAAPALLGKILVMNKGGGELLKMRITETECYLGIEDTACHASRGMTPRNSALWLEGGHSYVYLCYGMYYMFNVITGREADPQGVLIRGVEGYMGPGKFTRFCGIDMTHNRLDMRSSEMIWIEDDGFLPEVVASPRIGIGYADEADRARLWRFTDKRFFKK